MLFLPLPELLGHFNINLDYQTDPFEGRFKLHNSSGKHVREINTPTLIPYFYIVKLGYVGVYLFFLLYSLEPPGRGGSNMYPQSIF